MRKHQQLWSIFKLFGNLLHYPIYHKFCAHLQLQNSAVIYCLRNWYIFSELWGYQSSEVIRLYEVNISEFFIKRQILKSRKHTQHFGGFGAIWSDHIWLAASYMLTATEGMTNIWILAINPMEPFHVFKDKKYYTGLQFQIAAICWAIVMTRNCLLFLFFFFWGQVQVCFDSPYLKADCRIM